jgi:hypothetical protein
VAAYGAPVTFAVTTQPTNGTVEIDAQGFYTYTPNAALAAAGGFDSFVVTATDARFHLENLFGLPGRATTITVPVTVPATPAIPDSVPTQRTQAQTGDPTYTFEVGNFSSYRQIFGAVSKNVGRILAFPAVGTVLNLGKYASYEVQGNAYEEETQIQQTISSGSGGYSVLLDIRNDLNFWNRTGTWEASCSGTTVCSVQNTYDIILSDPQGTVKNVSESDTATREYVAQSVNASPQPNVTFYQEGPNSTAAMAPGATTRQPPLGSVMSATIGNTTYVGATNPGGWTPAEILAWEEWEQRNSG